jgi:hypothetical protein
MSSIKTKGSLILVQIEYKNLSKFFITLKRDGDSSIVERLTFIHEKKAFLGHSNNVSHFNGLQLNF